MFSKKQRRHTVVETLIGSNSKLHGDLHFKGGCHIDGTVKGNVTADPDTDSALSISDIGDVDGGVTVPYIVLNGIVNIVSSLQTVEALKLLAGRKDEMSRALVSIDVWEGSFRRLDLGDGPLPECPACGQERFEYLGAQWGSHATSLCGRNSVQITRKEGLTVDFEGLERKLGSLASVTRNRFMLKFECEGHGFTIFPDGRAIIQGTNDPTLARNLYAKYIGT